ncbi:MAG TPA: hypothetical protein VHC72_03030 [Bryobacteraceae bacterium]|nr:hypothetical protein [Bryobacteraceae bacterium]
MELLFAFWFAVTGLIWGSMIALFCFRTRTHPAAVGNEPGLPLLRLEAPGIFTLADQVAAELQFSYSPEFRADLGGAIVCPGSFIPNRELLQMVVIGLPVLAVLPAAEFADALRAQLRLIAVSPGLRFRVADLHHRLRAAREQSGNGILLPVEYLCRHALNSLADYAGNNPAADLSTLDRIGVEFDSFVADHVAPLITAGHLPPITEGFRRHWNSLDGVSPVTTATISLISNPAMLEERLANETVAGTGLERISWEQSSTVLLHSWLEMAARAPEPIRMLRCRDVAASDLLELGHRIYDQPGRLYDRGYLRGKVCRDIAVALVAAISKAGWRFDYDGPGTKYQFSRNSHVLLPFSMANGLLRGDGVHAWQIVCAEAGIADLQMG